MSKNSGRSGLRVPTVDAGEVRRGTGLTVEAFARRFGFTVSAIRSWEERRSQPYGVARTLLAIIACHPEVVDGVLHASQRPTVSP